MDVDKALTMVGGYKRWHISVFLLLGISSFMSLAIQNIGIVFIGWQPPHHCNIPDGRTFNGTIPRYLNELENGIWEEKNESCEMYITEGNKSKTVYCTDGYTFYDHDGYSTIVTQFELVCEKDFHTDISQIIYILGTIITDLIMSYFADSYGRKHIHILAHVLVGCFGIAEAFSWNYMTFVVLRTITGMLSQITVNSGITYLMELFPAKMRTFAGIGFEFPWVSVYLLSCLIAYFQTSWKSFQIIGSSLSFIWIVYLWLIPESISWLVANKQFDEAEKALLFIAKANGVPLHSTSQFNLDGCNQRKTPDEKEITNIERGRLHIDVKRRRSLLNDNVHLQDLFLDKNLRKHLLIGNLLWFSNAVIYYGLTLATPSLGKNRFFNYSIMGIVEIPANVVTLLVVKRYGRKVPLMVAFILAGIPLLLSMFVEYGVDDRSQLFGIVLSLALAAKFGITCSFSIMLLYTKELFPTNVRSSSTAWCSIAGGVGSMLAPFTVYVGRHIHWIPNAFFTAMSVIAALSVLLLPETKDKPLPLSTPEVYTIYYQK